MGKGSKRRGRYSNTGGLWVSDAVKDTGLLGEVEKDKQCLPRLAHVR